MFQFQWLYILFQIKCSENRYPLVVLPSYEPSQSLRSFGCSRRRWQKSCWVDALCAFIKGGIILRLSYNIYFFLRMRRPLSCKKLSSEWSYCVSDRKLLFFIQIQMGIYYIQPWILAHKTVAWNYCKVWKTVVLRLNHSPWFKSAFRFGFDSFGVDVWVVQLRLVICWRRWSCFMWNTWQRNWSLVAIPGRKLPTGRDPDKHGNSWKDTLNTSGQKVFVYGKKG